MSETGRVLKPANENPWYVLMTLYGEQNGGKVDWSLHEKNRAAWNAWSCQPMMGDKRKLSTLSTRRDFKQTSGWEQNAQAIMVQHKIEMERRNGKLFTYPGFPALGAMADLSGIEIEKSLDLRWYIFYAIKFDRASFSNPVCFASAWFCNSVSFLGVSFRSAVDFSEARFSTRCRFVGSTFESESKFNRSNFNGVVSFNDCSFVGDANFFMTKFGFLVGFVKVSFLSRIHFDRAKFNGGVSFSKTKFHGFCSLRSSTFDSKSIKYQIEFDGCIFESPTTFESVKFLNSFPDFSGSILHDKTLFSANAGSWPSRKQLDPQKAKASCAVIRHNLGKQGLPEEEHFFFRREMGFAAQIGRWWQRLPYRVFGALSDFGYSIQRPALWLLGLWLSVAMINHAVLQWGASREGADYHVVQAFGLSFANQFPVFGLQGRWFSTEFMHDLTPWLKALGGVQTVVALPLLFFFALGLRTRFRMR